MKVLIVEDSAILRQRIVGLFSGLAGIAAICEAQDAQEAFLAVRELHPDVMTLDIQLRTGNGVDVLKQVKRQLRAPIVIMLTNHSSPLYRRKCKDAGADFFLDKTTEFGELKYLMQRLLDGSFRQDRTP
ncbi:MAG TPA: response regulator transcription factor [Verrucomicrobiae bacterium]|jgi:DNA-binding NarL/FixJ family response regulator|nr:response regulator transcription factor [Verrucomicrobiae bacterium]